MKFYFVRHGESLLNLQQIHQDGTTSLSKSGLEQAKRAGKRLAKLPVDCIISSPFERAKQTAEAIGKAMEKEVILSPLFVEVKRPSEIEGRWFHEPEVAEIKNRIRDNWHDPNWRHSDEETFYDLRDRAIKALSYLVGLKNENTLVVLHGEILRMLIAVMIFGKDVDVIPYKSICKFLNLSNTGLTICKYEKDNWSLVTWNDHSHLKDSLLGNYKN